MALVAWTGWKTGGAGGLVRNSLSSGFIFNNKPTSVFVERVAVEYRRTWGSGDLLPHSLVVFFEERRVIN